MFGNYLTQFELRLSRDAVEKLVELLAAKLTTSGKHNLAPSDKLFFMLLRL